MDTSDYMRSADLSINSTSAVRNEKHYDCCPESYPNVEFTIKVNKD